MANWYYTATGATGTTGAGGAVCAGGAGGGGACTVVTLTENAQEHVMLPSGELVPYAEYLADAQRAAQQMQNKEIEYMPVKHRTQEEIEAQLLARYRELQEQAAQIKAAEEAERQRLKCSECRWVRQSFGAFSRSGDYCGNALVTGFDGPRPNVDYVEYMTKHRNGGYNLYPKVRLCGPEKALWEPIPTRWERLVEWVSKKFGWDSN